MKRWKEEGYGIGCEEIVVKRGCEKELGRKNWADEKSQHERSCLG